jgi:hypothetical protein
MYNILYVYTIYIIQWWYIYMYMYHSIYIYICILYELCDGAQKKRNAIYQRDAIIYNIYYILLYVY